MTRQEIKSAAKENLKGRWGTVMLVTLIYMVIVYALSYISEYIKNDMLTLLYEVIYFIIAVPLSYNLTMIFMKYRRNEEVNVEDIITKIPANFKTSWRCVGAVLYKMLPYIIGFIVLIFVISFATASVLVGSLAASATTVTVSSAILLLSTIAIIALCIPAIMKGLYYTFTQYIMIDSGNTMKAKDAADKSKEIMTGNRGKYFVFGLSFIGWSILAVLTFGIGMLWLTPYIQIATVIFYESLIGKKKVEEEPVKIEENNDPIQEN